MMSARASLESTTYTAYKWLWSQYFSSFIPLGVRSWLNKACPQSKEALMDLSGGIFEMNLKFGIFLKPRLFLDYAI